MATKIMMYHPPSGMTKPGFYGFSWTYLFFGPLVPLFRGHFEGSTSQILAAIASIWIWPILGSFVYNYHYTRNLLEKGWVLKGTQDELGRARKELSLG